MARVLVGCEFSGIVRESFAAFGHDAWSCDLLPTDQPGQHYQGDVRDLLDKQWDLFICHPPCTHLAISGAKHFAKKRESGVQQAALEFVRELLNANIPRICLENPISIIGTHIRKHTQLIHPWMFGHGQTKATCLWLKNLPNLVPTNIVAHRVPGTLYRPKGKVRSITYTGIAAAMAAQWEELLCL